MELTDPMDLARDFADTAAIIANLDLVISVDTSVAHLAGAMGKPVFLLDRYDNCWRWLHGRTDTPWYPSMTIFRQRAMANVRDLERGNAPRGGSAGIAGDLPEQSRWRHGLRADRWRRRPQGIIRGQRNGR